MVKRSSPLVIPLKFETPFSRVCELNTYLHRMMFNRPLDAGALRAGAGACGAAGRVRRGGTSQNCPKRNDTPGGVWYDGREKSRPMGGRNGGDMMQPEGFVKPINPQALMDILADVAGDQHGCNITITVTERDGSESA